MGRVINKDRFRNLSAELPVELVDQFKDKVKDEHKTITQKVRELIEAYVSDNN